MSAPSETGRKILRALLWTVCVCVALGAALVMLLALRFQPAARQYFVTALAQRFNSEVDLGSLNISFFPEVRVTGDHLSLRLNARHDILPIIELERFELEADPVSFFRTPKRIRRVRLTGLKMHLPPRPVQPNAKTESLGTPSTANALAPVVAPSFVLDEIDADGTLLEILPRDPKKKTLVFDLRSVTLRDLGPGQPMSFRVELNNPMPPGIVTTVGNFGPWNAARPVDTPVSGSYRFRNADLAVFKGITGILSSDGTYIGPLDRLEVKGTTDVPAFTLSSAGQPVPLRTTFQATVDGANGDTVLHPVHARIGSSEFDVTGSVERGAHEARKTIRLEARTNKSRLEDFLKLSVKGPQPPMTGALRFDTHIGIPPGITPVIERLELDGSFDLSGAKFTSPDVQEKIAALSHRAQGDPKDHSPDVTAEFSGNFHLRDAEMNLPDLKFNVPGAQISLAGTYGLRSSALDFKGTARLDATVSQMTTGIAHTLLRPLDPLFRRNGAGTVIPVIIKGTRGDPTFRFDFGRFFSRN